MAESSTIYGGSKLIDLQFTGLLGKLHHVTVPVEELRPEGGDSSVSNPDRGAVLPRLLIRKRRMQDDKF